MAKVGQVEMPPQQNPIPTAATSISPCIKLKLLLKRQVLNQIRNPKILRYQLICAIANIMIFSIAFWRMGEDYSPDSV